MKKLTVLTLLIALLLSFSGCGGNDGIYEGKEQKYYVADLLEDPNNRNVFRATTVWSEDAAFELFIPDYWEVKEDINDEYNTDIYLTSNAYEDDACVLLPGTMGYGVDDDLVIEEWMTILPNATASDYYFYRTISEEERWPVMRIVQFDDGGENYYLLELRYPEEGDYMSCHEDFDKMIETFSILDTTLEESYMEENIFQPMWNNIYIKDTDTYTKDESAVVSYNPGWIVTRGEDNIDYISTQEGMCQIDIKLMDIDLESVASYTEEVMIFDNNDMAKKYTVYDAEGNMEYIYVEVIHEELEYNFKISNIDEACLEDAEAAIKSFRTYGEAAAEAAGVEGDNEE